MRGFSELPPGGGALREADVREAYSWLQAVVETVVGIPSTFDDSQNAGATCRAAFAGVPANDPAATVKLGLDAVDRLAIRGIGPKIVGTYGRSLLTLLRGE